MMPDMDGIEVCKIAGISHNFLRRSLPFLQQEMKPLPKYRRWIPVVMTSLQTDQT